MKQLQIDEQKARTLFKTADSAFKQMLIDSFGESFFSEKITDRVKDFEDILRESGLIKFPRREEETDDEYNYRKAKLITKVLNEGWVPDWNNGNQAKWYAWFKMGGGFRFGASGCDYANSYTLVGSRLCFSSSEKAKFAAETFTDIYKGLLI
jgi:hypothetical protein